MNFIEVTAYLNSFINYESSLHKIKAEQFSLNGIKALMHALGNPQDNLRIVHVAGTKGKGSVSAMTASILKEAGYKVGLYTSPHLNNLRERIRILVLDKNSISDVDDIFLDSITENELFNILEEIKLKIDQVRAAQPLTFFEVLTAISLYYFSKENVDFVVLETGLGGRLDATNVVKSEVAVVTPISLEHTNILGNNLKEIVIEKAAIIKDKGQKVVLSPQEKEIKDILIDRCNKFSIKPFCVDKDKVDNLEISLLGKHQKINAAVSIGIINALIENGFDIKENAIRQGLKNLFWPGRFEVMKKDGFTIVLDCAHNVDSMKTVVETIKENFSPCKVVAVLGLSADKDRVGICQELNNISDEIIATRSQHPRAYSFNVDELKSLFKGKSCSIIYDIKDALEEAQNKADHKSVILVTGSLFVVNEARQLCIN
ncbi:MAG: folylpolyglutamate synthase/dihydrofolate synthase family protein [Candidatus Zapsychrus exili]|nr:folylpolyglutamate synthase/dihydrofolate synthase family protein [Candidatus Zapsychrus exili]